MYVRVYVYVCIKIIHLCMSYVLKRTLFSFSLHSLGVGKYVCLGKVAAGDQEQHTLEYQLGYRRGTRNPCGRDSLSKSNAHLSHFPVVKPSDVNIRVPKTEQLFDPWKVI